MSMKIQIKDGKTSILKQKFTNFKDLKSIMEDLEDKYEGRY